MKINLKPLDKLFSEFIRKRDKVCQKCGRSVGKLDAAHCFTRAKKSVKYDPDNACLLCWNPCHLYYDHHDTEKKEFFRKRLGKRAYDLLDYRAHRPAKIDIEAITLYLKNQIAKLEENQ